MNKTLSDDLDPLLTLQGVNWFVRKAISLATVVITINEYTEDDTVHVDITSVAAGVSTTQENRILDWMDHEHSDRVFGKVMGKSRFFKAADFKMEGPGPEEDVIFLKAEKLRDLQTDSRFLEDEHIQSWAASQGGGWTAEQIWGFEQINEARYYTRRVVVRKEAEVGRARLVYDYKGGAEAAKPVDEDADLAYGDD